MEGSVRYNHKWRILCTRRKVIVVKWTPGSKNVVDLFTKNMSGPQFEEFSKVFIKEDDYTPEPG